MTSESRRNFRRDLALSEGVEVKVRGYLDDEGIENSQGGQGPKENRTEGDIRVRSDIALEVCTAKPIASNRRYSIGLQKVENFRPTGRRAFYLFENNNIGRHMIVEAAKLNRLLIEVSEGRAKYGGIYAMVGDGDRVAFIVSPELMEGIAVCEAPDLRTLIRVWSQMLKQEEEGRPAADLVP